MAPKNRVRELKPDPGGENPFFSLARKEKKEPGRVDNGKYSNQREVETMRISRSKEGHCRKPKNATRRLEEKGITKTPGRESGNEVRMEKEDEGKMAGKENKPGKMESTTKGRRVH